VVCSVIFDDRHKMSVLEILDLGSLGLGPAGRTGKVTRDEIPPSSMDVCTCYPTLPACGWRVSQANATAWKKQAKAVRPRVGSKEAL
jgi:hypothetical protein